MSFFSKKAHEEIGMVFHINSADVRGAIVGFTQGGTPMLHRAHTEIMAPIAESSRASFIHEMVKALNTCATALVKESHVLERVSSKSIKIRKVFCVLSSPWFLSTTKIVTSVKPLPFTVDEIFVGRLVEDEKRLFLDKIKTADTSDETVLEAKIVTIKLNGYEISKPYGQRASSVEVMLYLSASPKSLMESIESTIHKHFTFKAFECHTMPLVTFSTMRNLEGLNDQYLVVEVGGEVTDIMLVKRGLLVETLSIPMGKNAFLLQSAKALKTIPQVTRSFIKARAEGKMDKAFSEKLKKSLDIAEMKWVSLFEEVLTKVSGEAFIPPKVFLVADDDIALYFKDVIGRAGFVQADSLRQEFEVVLLDHAVIAKNLSQAPNVKEDVILALDSIFVNHIYS